MIGKRPHKFEKNPLISGVEKSSQVEYETKAKK